MVLEENNNNKTPFFLTVENTWMCIPHYSNVNTRESVKTCCLPITIITVGQSIGVTNQHGYAPVCDLLVWGWQLWAAFLRSQLFLLSPAFQAVQCNHRQPHSRLRAQSKTCCCLEAEWNMETVLLHHGSMVFLVLVELFCLNSALERMGKREYLVKAVLLSWS